jgi:hypothetical protein
MTRSYAHDDAMTVRSHSGPERGHHNPTAATTTTAVPTVSQKARPLRGSPEDPESVLGCAIEASAAADGPGPGAAEPGVDAAIDAGGGEDDGVGTGAGVEAVGPADGLPGGRVPVGAGR